MYKLSILNNIIHITHRFNYFMHLTSGNTITLNAITRSICLKQICLINYAPVGM